MKKDELKQIIKEELNNFFFNKLIENYDYLEKNNFGFLQSNFLYLLREYQINLNDIYKSEKIYFPQFGDGFKFKDSRGNEHISAIQKTGTIKIGLLMYTNSNQPVISTIKRNSFQDEKILNTHVFNLIKLIDEIKFTQINFAPETNDQYFEARKRLFLNIVNQFPERVENVRTTGDNFELFLKQ